MVEAFIASELQHSLSIDVNKETWANVQFDHWLSRCTLDVIGQAGMGHDFNTIHNPDHELPQIYRTIFSPNRDAGVPSFLAGLLPSAVLSYLSLKRNREETAATARIRIISRKLIQQKQAQMTAAIARPDAVAVNKDILSVSLESGGFSLDDLVEQTVTFLAAGHETTSTAASWALIALAQRPAVQARLRDEIRANLAPFSSSSPSVDDTAPMAAAQIERLPYLQAVCNEVLRYFPPVPISRRIAGKNTTLLGRAIPAGTSIIIAQWAVNFSTAQWGSDAGVFDPERWLRAGGGCGGSGGTASNFANLTFLDGPRTCIGVRFARAELACLLAAIVGRLEFTLPEGVVWRDEKDVEMGVVAKPKGGARVRVRAVGGDAVPGGFGRCTP